MKGALVFYHWFCRIFFIEMWRFGIDNDCLVNYGFRLLDAFYKDVSMLLLHQPNKAILLQQKFVNLNFSCKLTDKQAWLCYNVAKLSQINEMKSLKAGAGLVLCQIKKHIKRGIKMCLAENLNFPQPSILSQLHQQVTILCS